MDWTAGSFASVGSTRLVGPLKWCRAGWLSALVAESLRGTRLAPALRNQRWHPRRQQQGGYDCSEFLCVPASIAMYPLK